MGSWEQWSRALPPPLPGAAGGGWEVQEQSWWLQTDRRQTTTTGHTTWCRNNSGLYKPGFIASTRARIKDSKEAGFIEDFSQRTYSTAHVSKFRHHLILFLYTCTCGMLDMTWTWLAPLALYYTILFWTILHCGRSQAVINKPKSTPKLAQSSGAVPYRLCLPLASPSLYTSTTANRQSCTTLVVASS